MLKGNVYGPLDAGQIAAALRVLALPYSQSYWRGEGAIKAAQAAVALGWVEASEGLVNQFSAFVAEWEQVYSLSPTKRGSEVYNLLDQLVEEEAAQHDLKTA